MIEKPMRRRERFIAGQIYHVFNKSIAGFGIFKDRSNSLRFYQGLNYYNSLSFRKRFSKLSKHEREEFAKNLLKPKKNALVKVLAYCIMPDHYHLLVKVEVSNTFSQFIENVENSFTRFFNERFKRKGPLWQSSFKAVRIKSNEQLLHVSRYIHLNPITAGIVDKPEKWRWSSYRIYIYEKQYLRKNLYEISIRDLLRYKKFCENRIDYQKRLKQIKKLLLE